jgi:hypothetical protein
MRVFINILAALLMVLGSIWFLQGLNILPGSFMAANFMLSQQDSTTRGGIVALVGLGLLLLNQTFGKRY